VPAVLAASPITLLYRNSFTSLPLVVQWSLALISPAETSFIERAFFL
jgi:hypothetical protein